MKTRKVVRQEFLKLLDAILLEGPNRGKKITFSIEIGDLPELLFEKEEGEGEDEKEDPVKEPGGEHK